MTTLILINQQQSHLANDLMGQFAIRNISVTNALIRSDMISVLYVGSAHVSNGALAAVVLASRRVWCALGAGQRSVSSNLAAASPLARNHRFVPARGEGGAGRPRPILT